MRFRTPPRLVSRNGVTRYIEGDLWSWMAEIFFGLSRLSFEENFYSFRVDDLTLPVGVEVPVNNQLVSRRANFIPSARLVIRQTGNGILVDGETPWTLQLLYIKNLGPDPITISIIFFK